MWPTELDRNFAIGFSHLFNFQCFTIKLYSSHFVKTLAYIELLTPLFLPATHLCDLELLFVMIRLRNLIQSWNSHCLSLGSHFLCHFLFPLAYFPYSLHSQREASKCIILEVFIYSNYFLPASSNFSTCQGFFLVRISSFLISVPFNEISRLDIIRSCFVRVSCCSGRTVHAFKQNMHFFFSSSSHTFFLQCFSYYVSMLWPLHPFQERHTVLQIIQCSECRTWKNILASSLSLLRREIGFLTFIFEWFDQKVFFH